MTNSKGLRLSLLCIALVATVIASFYPTTSNLVAEFSVGMEGKQETAVFSINMPAEVPIRLTESEIKDPFAKRQWATPITLAPAPVNQPTPAEVQAAPTVLPPQTPIMPYRYAGKLADGNDTVVYLSRSDQIFAVRTGDVVEGQYKVVSIDDRIVKLQRLDSSELQTLAIPSTEN